METKQKTLEAVQKSAPDLEGQSAKIQQQIVKINQQRAQIAVEYKGAVHVSLTMCPFCVLATRKTTFSWLKINFFAYLMLWVSGHKFY